MTTTVPLGRGALILIEGVDRAGKSTQCQLLVEYLSSEGIPVKYVRFPDRTTPIGQIIDSHLRSKLNIEDHAALHLLYSANRWEVAEAMKSALISGTSIVMDRYAFSGTAYSTARGGLSVEWCKSPDRGLPGSILNTTSFPPSHSSDLHKANSSGRCHSSECESRRPGFARRMGGRAVRQARVPGKSRSGLRISQRRRRRRLDPDPRRKRGPRGDPSHYQKDCNRSARKGAEKSALASALDGVIILIN